jgi:hypothetical protein
MAVVASISSVSNDFHMGGGCDYCVVMAVVQLSVKAMPPLLNLSV